MRNAVIASSTDGGQTWSAQRRVNTEVEAVQGEENGPKIAFDGNGRVFVVWSIPGEKDDKTRATSASRWRTTKAVSQTPSRSGCWRAFYRLSRPGSTRRQRRFHRRQHCE
jgi:hypothetical protein